jgi:signal peptidase II
MGMEIIIILIGVLVDRLTKLWALKTLTKSEGIEVLKNFFSLSYLENKGAAFGIFQNKQIYLSVITLLVIVGMIYYVFKYKPESKILRISFSLIISGAIGNLYDRLAYNFVVDFVQVHYKGKYFPTFNVADSLVVLGTCLLAIYVLKDGK